MINEHTWKIVMSVADERDCVFDYRDIAQWPEGTLEVFQRIGVLHMASGGLMAACPHCDNRHIETVGVHRGPDGNDRLYIWCPEELRVEVTAEMCRGWVVHPTSLAKSVAKAINPRGTASVIVPDRLWGVGHVEVGGNKRRVLFARQLGYGDAGAIAQHIGLGGRAIVLVPHQIPDERIWPGHVPAVLALSEIALVEDDRVCLDHELLMAIVGEADALAEIRSQMVVDPAIKKAVIREQLKAEIKSHLEDDALVAAYKKHGSMRKAATALTIQLGRSISKDKVQRAVDAAGGVEAMKSTDDSVSISRTVASQRCDRQKKFQERR